MAWRAGGGDRVRTCDLLRAREMLFQAELRPPIVKLVGLGGLEPPTLRLSGVRSKPPELEALNFAILEKRDSLPTRCALIISQSTSLRGGRGDRV